MSVAPRRRPASEVAAPLLIAAATFASALGLAGCDSRDSRERREDEGKAVLRRSIADDVRTWDPAEAYDPYSLSVLPAIHETLFQYDYLAPGYRVVPLLAADNPKISADGLTATIPIRRGVKYSDGAELTAGDFAHAFKRLSASTHGRWIFEHRLSEAAAPDAYTLVLKLSRPCPQLSRLLALPQTAPFRDKTAKPEPAPAPDDGAAQLPADLPLGTGPFVLKAWERGRQIVLERSRTHHPEFYPTDASPELRLAGYLADAGRTLPLLDRVRVLVRKDRAAEWRDFLADRLDLIEITRDRLHEAIIEGTTRANPALAKRGIAARSESGASFYFLIFNLKDPALGETKGGRGKLLRQAISSAIDRDRWIEVATGGSGARMVTSVPPGIEDRPATRAIRYDFDLDRARQLLAKAGYPGGKGLAPLKLELRGADPLNRELGAMFKKQLEAIGISLTVIENSFEAYLVKERASGFQIGYGGWALDYPDAENVLQLVYGPHGTAGGSNASGFDSPELNRLYDKLIVTPSGPERLALAQRMDDILQEEVPWAFGYYHVTTELSQPWLKNLRPSEIILNRAKYLRIDSRP